MPAETREEMAKQAAESQVPRLSTFQALAIASQFGASLAAAVALGLFAGQWLDAQLGTSVVFTLIGVFVGLGGAVTSTVAMYRAFLRQSTKASLATESQSDSSEMVDFPSRSHVKENTRT